MCLLWIIRTYSGYFFWKTMKRCLNRIRLYPIQNRVVSLKNCEGSETWFYPICKLTSQLTTITCMLAEGTRLLSWRQWTLWHMAQKAAWASAYLSAPHASHVPLGPCNGPREMLYMQWVCFTAEKPMDTYFLSKQQISQHMAEKQIPLPLESKQLRGCHTLVDLAYLVASVTN